MADTSIEKTRDLLRFLGEIARIRKKRIAEYQESDDVFCFSELPRDLPLHWANAISSAFLDEDPDQFPELWLEVRKQRKPEVPQLPPKLHNWVPQDFQNRPEKYINYSLADLESILNQQITIPDNDVPRTHGLSDHPDVQRDWIEFLNERWLPWAHEMRYWQSVEEIYQRLDSMRRHIEAAEENYELVMAVGMLYWKDPNGYQVKRHLLTAPAEITLDAERGILTVGPADSFEKFRIELDMLEPKDQPNLDDTDVESKLEDLGTNAWDHQSVAEIIRIIANKTTHDSQVNEHEWKYPERLDETFRVNYSPALVLRERRYTAYEEIVQGFLKLLDTQPAPSLPIPWKRLIDEGDSASSSPTYESQGVAQQNVFNTEGRLYFPLPTNEEQRQIIERLGSKPYLLVKGPPGTGKSHTIANLICHLLAQGQRVLVTAQAPKALSVLKNLLPEEMHPLCVTAFGSSREDHQMLEANIRAILEHKNRWNASQRETEIAQLEEQLKKLEDELADTDLQLRECRESEIHCHTLPGGYTGTAAQIARIVSEQQDNYGWFPELTDQKPCPIEQPDIDWFARFHASLTTERSNELELNLSENVKNFPDANDFQAAIKNLATSQEEAERAEKNMSPEQVETAKELARNHSSEVLTNGLVCLERIKDACAISYTLYEKGGEVLQEVLSYDQPQRWQTLQSNISSVCNQIRQTPEPIRNMRVDVPHDVANSRLLQDAQNRLQHFRNGGWRGWGFLAPKIVRSTRYVEKTCRVEGIPPIDQDSLDKLVQYLELRQLLQEFSQLWPATIALHEQCNLGRALLLAESLANLLDTLTEHGEALITIVPKRDRIKLQDSDIIDQWCRIIKAAAAYRKVADCESTFQRWLGGLQRLCSGNNVHPCMFDFISAIEARSVDKWKEAWDKRQELIKDKENFKRYQEIEKRILSECPNLRDVLDSSKGNAEWTNKLLNLEQAWNWALAKLWISTVSNHERYDRLERRRKKLQKDIESALKKLAALKAWSQFFKRIDENTEQCLTAWTKAIARVGKGTGKHAPKHRRQARAYLMQCIPSIPAWIMPLYKLWETTEPKAGIFDAVIIDEASQAGLDALLLFFLGSRVIVVGDDKQNSPEAVGILEDDIERLASSHLKSFFFRREFRPDASLYDHAERAFGNLVSLREHFRCVPEIIEFSNHLFYNNTLIPLRQPPPDRLDPLKSVFVETGSCEGSGQRIYNRAEAERIVKQIKECLNNEAYNGKTMGVIALQGHAQAELIDRMLAEELEPKAREERKLRVGVPATFQGDERDVMFLSLVIAPKHQYRALTGLPDERRFNVAMSRARDQVWLFHSVKLEDLSSQDLRSKLLRFFQIPHLMVQSAVHEELSRLNDALRNSRRELGEQPEPYESWFEVDVAVELLRKNYRVIPQFEVAGYRIDLVVEGQQNRLAIECDGEQWHGADRFDYDVARQRQLERAGWQFVRVRESEFYADRNRTINRIVHECNRLDILPVGGINQ
jgi:very-short-patch-repair endonuclease